MIDKVVHTITTKHLLTKGQHVLVAVSGGVDSIVLLDILYKSGYKCIVAHVNFKLRGDASDKDESFVSECCKSYGIPFFTKSFETADYAKRKHISLEMAARDLRYTWFGKLCEKEGIDAVAVGHHMDDQVETFFLNLVRGSGTKGLSAMQFRNGNIIRPLLEISRTEVLNYAQSHSLNWREDSSNKENTYKRNQFRNTILPALKEQNPSISETIIRTIHKMREGHQIISRYVNLWSSMYLKEKDETFLIPILPLSKSDGPQTLLFELISKHGFNEAQVSDILSQMEDNSGKIFYGNSKRLLIDRHELIISDFAREEEQYIIEEDLKTDHLPLKLNASFKQVSNSTMIPKVPNKVWLDAAKISFPLTLRPWKNGDQFIPFGMKGSKKLSDYFVDEKLSVFEKETIWLLESSDHIIWILGHRCDERVKVKPSTKKILSLELLK